MVSTSPSTSARDNFSRAAPRRGNRIKSAAASLCPESRKSMRVRCSLHPSMAAVRFSDLQEPAKHKRFGGVIRQAADTVLSKATGYFGHTDHACIETEGRYVLSVQWETLGDHTVALVGWSVGSVLPRDVYARNRRICRRRPQSRAETGAHAEDSERSQETFGIPLNKVVWRRRPKTSRAVAFSAASVKRLKAARLPT